MKSEEVEGERKKGKREREKERKKERENTRSQEKFPLTTVLMTIFLDSV